MKTNIKVRVRHSVDCPDKAKGADWQDCQCWKSLLVYHGGGQKWESANTRSWATATRIAKERLEDFDPLVIENKRLKAEAVAKETKTVSIEDAIKAFLDDGRTRQLAAGSLRNIRTFEGRLTGWINSQPSKLVYLHELTPDHLSAWRNTWKLAPNTAAQAWNVAKMFFAFCVSRNWIAQSPAAKMKSLPKSKVNDTAIFSDDQYAAILDAVYLCGHDGNPKANLANWHHRLLAFVELLRWSGCDLSDAIQFRPEQLRDGVFRYQRQKTKILAVVPLPDHVVILLRDLPLEEGSVGTGMPFRTKNTELESDVRKVQFTFAQLFKHAGIDTVITASGKTKRPHCKMFRHTCAVSHLVHGSSLLAVSKYLGHRNPEITARVYLPWIAELENHVIAEGRKSMAAALPKPSGKVVPMRKKA